MCTLEGSRYRVRRDLVHRDEGISWVMDQKIFWTISKWLHVIVYDYGQIV